MTVLAKIDDISGTIKHYFPEAECIGEVVQGRFELRCRLTQNLPEFRIDRVLDNKEFSEALSNLNQRVRFHENIHTPLSDPDFDIQRFSLVPPLSNWQSFQRASLKVTGTSCEDVLMKFLEGSQDALLKLEQIGLSPNQINQEHREEDLEIFRKMDKKLEQTPQKAKTIFQNFERHYPGVFKIIQKELIQLHQKKPEQQTHYQNYLDFLKQKVKGQDKVSEIVASSLVSQQREDGNKIFLFVGPTGVGKTEMAKAIGNKKNDRYISFFMNQYQDEHTSSNLFGSPAGYVGSTSRPQLATEFQKFEPKRIGSEGNTTKYELENVVVLFDELEKAHSNVKQSLLTLLDEGYCVVQYTSNGTNISEKYVLKKSIIIGTSNLFQQYIKAHLAENLDLILIREQFATWNSKFASSLKFSPEFLGRFTSIAAFGPIPRGDIYRELLESKIKDQLPVLKAVFSCKEVRLENKPRLLELLEDRLYGDGTDMRKIKSYFEQNLKPVFFQNIASKLNEDILPNLIVVIAASSQDITIRAQTEHHQCMIDLTDSFPIN